MKFCYSCGEPYNGDMCPKCSSTLHTDKANSRFIGRKVWIKNNHSIIETEIATVGRKYVTVKWNPRLKFYSDNLKEADYIGEQLFIIVDLDKYYEEEYCIKLARKLIRFDWNKLNKKELDKVKDVIQKYLEE